MRIDADRVRVQPGVVQERLNEQLRTAGRLFGPDPANSAVTTIGGMIAINAAGSRWLKYGSTRRHVESLQVVLADGQVLELGREPLADGQGAGGIPRKRELVARLADLLARNAELIGRQPAEMSAEPLRVQPGGRAGRRISRRGAAVGRFGGNAGVGDRGHVDASSRCRFTAASPCLLFDSVEKAARTVPDILAHGVTACELMDRRHVSLAREAEPRFERLVPPEAEAVLLVEQDGEDLPELRGRLHRLVGELWQQKRLAFGAREAFEDDETELFWRLVDRVEAGAVPVARAEPAGARGRGHGRRPRVAGRVPGAGAKRAQAQPGHRVAVLPRRPGPGPPAAVPRPGQRRRRAADAALGRGALPGGARACEGSIGGVHASGLSRTQFIRQQAGPLYDVFVEIKRIFDPDQPVESRQDHRRRPRSDNAALAAADARRCGAGAVGDGRPRSAEPPTAGRKRPRRKRRRWPRRGAAAGRHGAGTRVTRRRRRCGTWSSCS